MERLISSTALRAALAPVTKDDFITALEEEPSDFDRAVAAKNAKFDRAHGWGSRHARTSDLYLPIRPPPAAQPAVAATMRPMLVMTLKPVHSLTHAAFAG